MAMSVGDYGYPARLANGTRGVGLCTPVVGAADFALPARIGSARTVVKASVKNVADAYRRPATLAGTDTQTLANLRWVSGWIRKADVPGNRYLACGAGVDGRIFKGFGYTYSNFSKQLYEYIKSSNTWEGRASLPDGSPGRYGAVMAHGGGDIFAGLGAYFPPYYAYLADWLRYSVDDNAWSACADFTGSPRYQASAVSTGGHIYVGGGWTSSPSWELYGDIRRYSVESDSWTVLSPFPTVFPGKSILDTSYGVYNVGPAAALCNGKIYFGLGGSYEGSSFWAYDLASDSWEACATYPTGSIYSGAFSTFAGKIYQIGLNTVSSEKRLYYYTPLADSWDYEVISGTASPVIREGVIAVADNEGIYVGDGFATPYDNPQWWLYSPALRPYGIPI